MLRTYCEGNFIMAGREDREILETIEHYNKRGAEIALPEKEEIIDSKKLVVFLMLPIADLTQEFLQVCPTEDTLFQVHPNAYLFLQHQATKYESALRGGLYKIDPGRDLSRMPSPDKLSDPRIACYFFVPKDVMEGLRSYDWTQHTEEAGVGMLRAEKRLGNHPNISISNNLESNVQRLRLEQERRTRSN